MVKVILITSREIKANNNPIQLSFSQYDPNKNMKEWRNSYLVQFSHRWASIISHFSPQEARPSLKMESANDLNEAMSIASDVVSKMDTRYKNTSSPFELGIFKKEEKGTYIYWAEEYPFLDEGFSTNKQLYLNAIITVVKNDLNNSPIVEKEVLWELFSHDKDWGKNEKNYVLPTEEKDKYANTINNNDFPSLKSIVKDERTKIHLFQHVVSDDTYLYVKNLIENDGFPDFDDFVDKSKEQKRIFMDYLKSQSDENWRKLMSIDVNYPFMPFDLVNNPIK